MTNSPDKKLIAILIALGVMFLVVVIVLACLGMGWFVYRSSTNSAPQVTQVTVEVTRPAPLSPTPPPDQPAAPTAPAPTQPAVPTAVPPTAVPPTAAPVPDVVYGNVSLMLDPAVASGANPLTVPASLPIPDGPYWDVYPDYTEINLTGYLLADTFHKPRINVYPVAEYEAMGDPVREVINNTRQLLKNRPAEVNYIHTLPIWNAGQVFHARLHYLDFKTGSGVAFLTEYAQYTAPINNHDMFYNFQGLTRDGRYYVVATLPVGHPNLPPDADLSQDEYQKLDADYQGYLDQVITMLESQSPNSFAPSLEKLDDLIRSIEVR